ncbi:seryl-tRNA synthetase [Syncephalis plumigaleata]|nr:seryl-tRNA synthetase [Syncephalis plumigaleata]
MLDINILFEDKGGNPELIRESQRRRGAPVEVVDEIIELYKTWTRVRFDLDQVNKNMNALKKEIGQKMKAKQDASDLLEKKNELQRQKDALEASVTESESAWKVKLGGIGNLVHDSVPVSMDEDNNEIVRTWNVDDKTPEHRTDILPHHEVLYRLDGFDAERGSNVAGHRGSSLLMMRSYKKLQTPFMMKKEVMAKTAQLEQFDEELYKVTGDVSYCHIEQPISAFHANEWFEKITETLPIRYAGYSTCFRKEAGAHGKDTWGIFRVHQFEKIEQFCLTEPGKSWEMFDEMIATSEAFYQSLGLSYRVVSIVSGALNNAAAKKYDLEAWFPFQGAYKELVSCSNCTDYQSRRLEIRCGSKKMGDREKKYVHA